MKPILGVLLVALAGCHPAAPMPRDVQTVDSGARPAATRPAAESVSAAPQGDSECARDADCALTYTLPSCCSGCAPRALSVTARVALEAQCKGQGASCIQPLCRAPPAPPVAVCIQGRCEVGRARAPRE